MQDKKTPLVDAFIWNSDLTSENEFYSYGAILKEKEIKIPADDIKIPLPIRSLGEHQIEINPYEGIVEYINISVNKN